MSFYSADVPVDVRITTFPPSASWNASAVPGRTGVIVDEQNEIRLLVPGTTEVPSDPHYHYFGLIPLDQQLTGVTIIGAKYEVSDSDLERWSSLGVSNELVPGRRCVVKIKHGVGLLIRSN